MWLYGANYSCGARNNVLVNTRFGVCNYYSVFCPVYNNISFGSYAYGIYIGGTSARCSVRGNIVLNTVTGMYLNYILDCSAYITQKVIKKTPAPTLFERVCDGMEYGTLKNNSFLDYYNLHFGGYGGKVKIIDSILEPNPVNSCVIS